MQDMYDEVHGNSCGQQLFPEDELIISKHSGNPMYKNKGMGDMNMNPDMKNMLMGDDKLPKIALDE